MMIDISQRYTSSTGNSAPIRELHVTAAEPEPSKGGLMAVVAAIAALVRRR